MKHKGVIQSSTKKSSNNLLCGIDLAILFWFYKDLKICENRLKMLRKNNPDILIYGLYGGNPKKSDEYKRVLSIYLDDFYTFTGNLDSVWKWNNGDLMIVEWYSEHGKNLRWDSIVIVQWDMLIFRSISRLFSMIQKDQILLSGLRPIKEVESWWYWVNHNEPDLRSRYVEFLKHVKKKYNYNEEPLCCLFIVVCFPRSFLQKYSETENIDLGFIEYRVPIYGQILKTSFCIEHPFNPWWPSDPSTKNPKEKILKPIGSEIPFRTILKHLINPRGSRIFHPYRKIFPIGIKQWLLTYNICKMAAKAAFKIWRKAYIQFHRYWGNFTLKNIFTN